MTATATYQTNFGSLNVPSLWMAMYGIPRRDLLQLAASHAIKKATAVQLYCDAVRLALRLESVATAKPFEALPIEPNAARIATIYHALLAIAVDEHPAARFIQGRQLHTAPNPNLDRLAIIYPTLAQPTNGTFTLFEPLQELCKAYDLTIGKHYTWDSAHEGCTLFAAYPLNMAALAPILTNIAGVAEVQSPSLIDTANWHRHDTFNGTFSDILYHEGNDKGFTLEYVCYNGSAQSPPQHIFCEVSLPHRQNSLALPSVHFVDTTNDAPQATNGGYHLAPHAVTLYPFSAARGRAE